MSLCVIFNFFDFGSVGNIGCYKYVFEGSVQSFSLPLLLPRHVCDPITTSCVGLEATL